MEFLNDHPQFIFRNEVQPEYLDDLTDIDDLSTELAIHGKTKNINRLKHFNELAKLWIYSVNQKELNKILELVNPKMLYIYNIRAEDLSLISLLTNLEILALEWNSKASTLWDLSKNEKLKALSIKDFSKLFDITPLQKSKKLELLDLSGGESNALKLNNLESLESLNGLKYLGLSNIKVQNESLQPISKLKGLQELEISNEFPTEEYARLSVSLPNVKCVHFKPYIFLLSPIGDKDTMVVGKKKPFLNSKVDNEKLIKYGEEFKNLQDRFLKVDV